MIKFIKKHAELKMQIHEKLQIWTIKCLMSKQILTLKGNFWDIDPLNSPILWKFKIRLTPHPSRLSCRVYYPPANHLEIMFPFFFKIFYIWHLLEKHILSFITLFVIFAMSASIYFICNSLPRFSLLLIHCLQFSVCIVQ